MKERLKQFLDTEQLTANMAALKIGINASSISHLLNGNRKPSFEVIEKISSAFPRLDMNWLITGEGEMYREKDTTVQNNLITNTGSLTESERGDVTLKKEMEEKKLERILLFYSDGSFEEHKIRD